MAGGKRTTIEGEEKVARAFDELAKRALRTGDLDREMAEIGLDAARGAAPVHTGELVASIRSEIGEEGAEIESDVGYAPFVEFGTEDTPAVPFMAAGHAAMEERAEAIGTAWAQEILDDVDRMA